MKVEALENRQLLSHEALLLSGDATATDHATEFMGNTYNGFEQSSLVASYAATPGELTRVSFLDLDGDVVFAEFGGNGKLTISFEQYVPGQPSPYLQSSTWYSQGLATLSVSGGDGSTFLSVFSLGNDPDRVDAAIIDGDPDDPTSASFEGANFMADIRAVEVLGDEGQVNHFGGLGLANTNFTGTGSPGDGKLTGVIAPNVRILQYLRIGDVNTAGQTAMPIISIHPSSLLNEDGGVVEIAGGDLNVNPKATRSKPADSHSPTRPSTAGFRSTAPAWTGILSPPTVSRRLISSTSTWRTSGRGKAISASFSESTPTRLRMT